MSSELVRDGNWVVKRAKNGGLVHARCDPSH